MSSREVFYDDPTLSDEERLQRLEEHLLENMKSKAVPIPEEAMKPENFLEFCREHVRGSK